MAQLAKGLSARMKIRVQILRMCVPKNAGFGCDSTR